MLPDQKTLIRETWRQVEPCAGSAATLFYDRLFEIDPSLRKLFTGVDMESQGKKLTQALAAVVGALDHIETLVPELQALGRRHTRYGVTDAHYETVGAALLWTLEKGLGNSWTDEAKSAWTAAYSVVSDVMQTANRATAGPKGQRHQTRRNRHSNSLPPTSRRNQMNKAYWIVRVSVRDAEQYPAYLTAAQPAFQRFGARFLVRGGRYDAMEGTSRERNVVVEFKDYETAVACYRSPEYEAAKVIRNANADADFIIVEGAAA